MAQREDVTLKEMFSAILSPEEVESAASGCFVEGLLLRKWLSGREVFLGEACFQVVVPLFRRDTMLQYGTLGPCRAIWGQ